MNDLVAAGRDFAFETTLSSVGYARRIHGWQARGYEVELNYIRLADAQASVARVAKRVAQGGHGIPERDLLRRFGRSLANVEVYQRLVDQWAVWESCEDGVILLGRSYE